MKIGEGFAGHGVNAAHVNTVVGVREGPVGVAWASALASPSQGHTPFVVVVRPDLPVKPMTLFVNKATIAGERHGRLTWGAAQAGIAAGVVAALRDDIVRAEDLCIAAVWVDPAADDEEAVFASNRDAMVAALLAGSHDRPAARDVLAAGEPENPYFRS